MKLVVTSGADPGRVIDVDRDLVVGRVDPADVVLVDPRISGRHARLRPGAGGATIEDLGSSNGTLVNEERVTAPRPLRDGDVIRLGDTSLRVDGVAQATVVGETVAWQLAVRTGPDAGMTRALSDGEDIVIGRGEEAGLALTDARVSTRHAEVSLRSGTVTLRDLDSANGTLLNGSPVSRATKLSAGSEIQVGETVIVAGTEPTDPSGPTPTVIGTLPAELTERRRSRRTLVGAGIAGTLILAAGITVGALVLTREEEGPLTTADIVRANRDATVLILSKQDGQLRSSGSGFVVDAEQGLIVTNNHVATGGALSVQPEAARTSQVDATLVGAMPCEDLALVKVENADVLKAIRPVTLATTPFEQGDPVVALGYPGSAESGREFGKDSLSATSGIVSKVEARYDVPRSGVPLLTSVIQHTAAVNPGNSGGPLFDDAGELIGVNTAIFAFGGSQRAEGESYAVTITRLNERLDALKRGDAPDWLGLALGGTITDEVSQEVIGVAIEGVTPDSPADKAGIRGGSVLLAIDGTQIADIHDYCDAVPDAEGTDVRVSVGVPGFPLQELTIKVGNNDG